MVQEVEIVDKIKRELIDDCNSRHRLVVGGRGKGASWSIARILLMEGMSEPLFIVCVREVQKTIKESVKKLLEDTIKKLNWSFFYTSFLNEIRGINGTRFIFVGLQSYNANNIKSLEGCNRCWVAEAEAISRKSLNILRPTIRVAGSIFWWDFNPRYNTDPVYIDYILNDDPSAKVCMVSWRDNPWFSDALMEEKKSSYQRDKKEADHVWEGVLLPGEDVFIFTESLVDSSMKNDESFISGDIVVGADIAHQGGDEIVFFKRCGNKIVDVYTNVYMSTRETFARLKLFAGNKDCKINIDNGSIGAAIADSLDDSGYNVSRINFGGSPKDKAHYEDCVTEMYFNLREKMPKISLPYDLELKGQLIQRKYSHISGRRGYEVVKIESKKDFKKHAFGINKSPDRADALAMCFYDVENRSDFGETFDEYSIL